MTLAEAHPATLPYVGEKRKADTAHKASESEVHADMGTGINLSSPASSEVSLGEDT
jgi:hypothetical protein